MALSHLPPFLTSAFDALARWLDRRSAKRLPLLLYGLLFARGRRTVTSWPRAAGTTDDFRLAYPTARAAGRKADDLAVSALRAIEPALGRGRLTVAIDDTPTPRYGPRVEGQASTTTPPPAPPARSTSTATS